MRTPISFATMIMLITSIILTGAIITISISLTDTLAFSDKIALKEIQQKDDDNEKNYQQMYKQFDFEKYLNYHYTYIKEYDENHNSNSGADISDKYPFTALALSNFFNDKDNNKKVKEKQQQSDRDKDADKAKYILELDNKKHITDDEKKYSSDKNNKKTYKNIKIIECRNLNIKAYEVEDLKSIETLLNKPTIFENDDDGISNQQGNSHSENNGRGEAKEYVINSNTKVIFICNNENHDLRPIKSNNNNLIPPLTSDGIIIPMYPQKNNNNNNDDDKTPTTITYAQYKKSIANDQN